ncbi:alpha/beta fold hydrolase [Burkholderiaceae bacterium UC74_6]
MKRRRFVQGMSAASLGLPWGLDAQANATERQPTPVKGFVEGPLLSDYSLSPDGKKLVMVMNSADKSTIVTRDLTTGKTAGVIQTDNLEFKIRWVEWANNNRLVFSLVYLFKRDGDSATTKSEGYETRLFAADADGSNQINLIKKTLTQSGGMYSGQYSHIQDHVIDFLPEDPDHILLTLRHDDFTVGTAVYKVDVNTAERRLYEAPRSNISFEYTDASHRVRIGYVWDTKKGGGRELWICDPSGENWRQFNKEKVEFNEKAISVLGFGLDPNVLYVSSRNNGLTAIYTMDLREAKPTLTLKMADPDFNLNGVLIHDLSGEAVGISVVDNKGTSSRYYWHPNYQAMQAQFDKILPKRWNRLAGLSRFGGSFLLSTTEPGRPSQLMLGSLVTGKLDVLSSQYPGLDPQRIALKKPFDFKARDGFQLHAFLTLPIGSKAKNLPLVVLPHGGPQSHDTIGFDELSAFAADRGYAVLQVNFRGSTGYGWDYMKAGLRRCGLETQDDVTDGVKKLIADGVVDPARISIVGWSFGGYSALQGVAKDPELYRGAFAVAPVCNLQDWISDWYSFGQREVLREQIGDSKDDAEQLRATSPVFYAEKIKVPVVILHGTQDQQVDYSQSEQMDAALTKAGHKQHKFITFDRGDHGLSHRPYFERVLKELEAFLQQTLGPGAPLDA